MPDISRGVDWIKPVEKYLLQKDLESFSFSEGSLSKAHSCPLSLTLSINARRPLWFDVFSVFIDKNTPRPFIEDYVPLGDDGEAKSAAKPDHIYMDAMGFGMGCCCLQVGLRGHLSVKFLVFPFV